MTNITISNLWLMAAGWSLGGTVMIFFGKKSWTTWFETTLDIVLFCLILTALSFWS